MQHIYNSWEQLLYKCWTMKKILCQAENKAQYTTHCPPCVQTCTQSHDKHTFLTVQACELAYMSLYIIYLYLVKNKLHNSTNLENCFFELKNYIKMKRKRIFFFNSNQANYCVWVFCAGGKSFHQNLRIGGIEGEKYKTNLSPHLQILLHSSPSGTKKQKQKGAGKGQKRKRPYRKHSFFQKTVLCYIQVKEKGVRRGRGAWGGGVNTIQIPNTQYFTS